MTERMTPKERHALVEASHVFEDHGIQISMPWECDLDDREEELYRALRDACRAYHAWMTGGHGEEAKEG